jgi:hypothetical protein
MLITTLVLSGYSNRCQVTVAIIRNNLGSHFLYDPLYHCIVLALLRYFDDVTSLSERILYRKIGESG